MALNELGCHAISLTGWQAGFRTDRAYTKARITRLETERISSELERNRVVVVAGFQGLNKMDDITTLGRGGSDTSAVAIAAALHADRCQIFTDVEGVTRPTRARCATPASWMRSPLTRCWSWHLWVHRC